MRGVFFATRARTARYTAAFAPVPIRIQSMHPSIHAQTDPDKLAFIMAAGGDAVTYRQLEDCSNRIAHLLRDHGLTAGDHIVLLLENHPRFFEICFGAHRAGIIYTAMSTRLTLDEAAYIVADCTARLIVTSRAMSGLAAQLVEQMPGVTTRLMLDGVIDGYTSYEEEIAACPEHRIADESAGGDMLYSSGTTGRPKGVFVPPDSPLIDVRAGPRSVMSATWMTRAICSSPTARRT